VSTLGKQIAVFIFVSFFALQACSANGGGGARPPVDTRPAPTSVKLAAPKSVSPGTIPAPPMASTTLQSAESTGKRFPKSDIGAPQWVQLTGGASQISAAGDGSFWVLSPDGPSGGVNAADKFIYHNVNGVWTNVGGAAAHISAAQDGSLWVVNSLGGIYHNINNTWYSVAGGAKDISVAPDGTIYVISKAPGNAGIFHYDGANWTQLPGAGTTIAASPDTASHGVFAAGGVWVTNSFGEIYYFSPSIGFTQLSGKAAQIVPTKNGGIFVLGFPVISSGNPLYYNNLDTGVWTQIPGGAVNLATDTNYLYAIGGTGGIYKTPVLPASTPASVPSASPTAPSPQPTATSTPAPSSSLALFANDRTFLGLYYSDASNSCFNASSLGNRYSQYGNKFSALSIWNQFGTYGSQSQPLSPYDAFSTTPPYLINAQNQIVAYISKNQYVFVGPSLLVDPDALQNIFITQCGGGSYR